MTNQTLRNTIINLLDDEDGVNSLGHDGLVQLCIENGWDDVNQLTELDEGRAYLFEEDAEELRKVVVS